MSEAESLRFSQRASAAIQGMPYPASANRPTAEQVHAAIAKILADTASYESSLNYAVNYCRYAGMMTGEMLRVQCLYILENIMSWRHADAKEVRAILRSYSKP